MRKRVIAIFCLFALATLPAALAQDAGFVNVLDVHVELGQQQQYEGALTKLWDAFKKAGVTHQISVSTSADEPGTYTFVAPVSSLADLGVLQGKVNQAFASAPAVMGTIQGSTRSQDQSVWALRPDLSYTPAKPRLQDAEMGFTRIAFLYARPDQLQAFEAALREVAEIRKKHGLTDGTSVGQLLIGEDAPVYAVLIGAKDQADFYAQNAKDTAKMGADWQAYLNKVGPMMRRVELRGATALPELGYQP